jgi:hypothetical protein
MINPNGIALEQGAMQLGIADPVTSGNYLYIPWKKFAANPKDKSVDDATSANRVNGVSYGSMLKTLVGMEYSVTSERQYGPGTQQVTTATVVGTIGASGGGTLTIIVTSAALTGSPKTYTVTVPNAATAQGCAALIRAALLADTTALGTLYYVGGTGVNITLTQIAMTGNDATLNLSIALGTATGLTAAPTSAATTAGVQETLIPAQAALVNAANKTGAAAITGFCMLFPEGGYITMQCNVMNLKMLGGDYGGEAVFEFTLEQRGAATVGT